MSCIPRLTKLLRSRGYRMTPQRLSILQALHDGGHLSPAQIYERVQQTGMTETTVYRTLEFLAKNGVVEVADRGNGHLAYELAGNSHHHIICSNCNRVIEFEDCGLESLCHELEQRFHVHLTGHLLEFYGLCDDCGG